MGTMVLSWPKRSAKKGGITRAGAPAPLRIMVMVMEVEKGRPMISEPKEES